MPEPSRLPLTGADCFLRAFDAQTRRYNRSSHLSQLVLRLGPGFDIERFRETVAAVADACPILRAPIRRSGLGAPAYRLDLARRAAPTVAEHHSALPRGAVRFDPLGHAAPIPSVFFQRLNAPVSIRRGELVRFDCVRYGRRGDEDLGSDLAITWAHMLMDGSGSEAFAAHLAAVAAGERAPGELPEGEWTAPATPPPTGSFRERGDAARKWQAHMHAMADPGVHSLAGPLAKISQDLHYGVLTLDPDASKRAAERASAKAGFLTPMLFYLAAAMRAHDAVFRARGLDPGSYVVPLPVNVRPKGSERAIFRTRVSMLWFQVPPEVVRDFDGLIDELRRQRHAMIKDGAVENGLAAMDMARFAPMWVYGRMARRNFAGELCSFFFAYTGDFMEGTDALSGAPILNGFHTPSVPASPGSGSILCRRAGRLNAAHVHQRGLFSAHELALYAERLRSDLLAEDGSGG